MAKSNNLVVQTAAAVSKLSKAENPADLTVGVVEALRAAGVIMTFTGAQMPDFEATPDGFALWADIGRLILFLDKRNRVAFNFSLGDWYNAGQAIGQGLSAEDWLHQHFPDQNIRTVQAYAVTAARFAFAMRSDRVDWSTYAELTYVEDSVRPKLLAHAVNKDIPAAQLRQMVKNLKTNRQLLIAKKQEAEGRGKRKPADSLPLQPTTEVPLDAMAEQVLAAVQEPEEPMPLMAELEHADLETADNPEDPGDIDIPDLVEVPTAGVSRTQPQEPKPGTYVDLEDPYWNPRILAIRKYITEAEGEEHTLAGCVDWCLTFVMEAEGIRV